MLWNIQFREIFGRCLVRLNLLLLNRVCILFKVRDESICKFLWVNVVALLVAFGTTDMTASLKRIIYLHSIMCEMCLSDICMV